jgi:hypothetical protein
MIEGTTRTTTNAAASPQATAALAEFEELNPEQQQIVKNVLQANPVLSLDEVLAALIEAAL